MGNSFAGFVASYPYLLCLILSCWTGGVGVGGWTALTFAIMARCLNVDGFGGG